MKTSFAVGLMFVVLSGLGVNYLYNNFRYKEVVNSQGKKSTCQVIKYRFWYEIKNCSDKTLNRTQVGLNQIKEYQVQ